MRALRRFAIRLAQSATKRRDDDRLRDELEEHIALQTAENVRNGLSPSEAKRQALLRFGPVEAIKENYRDEQSLPALDILLQDARYAFRQFGKAPLFTFTAALSLAIGIGANSAVFTVIERVLLRPLPVLNPQELVFVTDQRIQQEPSPRFSYPFFAALRDNGVLHGVAAHYRLAVNATTRGQVMRVSGELVSGSYFGVLGATTQLGRPLSVEDDRTPGAHPVAVISDGFWRRTFASDPSVLGRDVQINGRAFTIVGVAARGFIGTDVGSPTDIWLPLIMQGAVGRDFLTEARTNWLEIIGRLRSRMNLERAGEALTLDFQRRAPELQTQFADRRLILVPGDKGYSGVRGELGPALKLLLALMMLALALACVNVASLLALRSVSREKEIAIRLALGAGRSRLTRQFLTETLLLAFIGGAAGLLVAPWAAGLLVTWQPHRLDIDTSLDARVFLFGFGASLLTGLIIGQAPILASSKVAITQAPEHSARVPGSFSRLPVQDLIVACQIALSLAMLISAALLVQSLRSLQSVDPGFRADNLLLMSVDPAAAGYAGNRMEGFWRDSLERMGHIHGVESASVARLVPLAPGRQRQPVFDPTSGEFTEIDANVVGPRYFRTLAIPLLGGREFDERDRTASRPVVIVNERLAKMFWPGQDPVGRELRIKGLPNGSAAEVIGLVKDAKYRDLRGDFGPMVYRAALQTSSSDAMTLHVRAAGDPIILAGALRSEMQLLDVNVPLFGMTTLEDRLNESFAQTRQAAMLTGAFGVLALLLSGVGVYGVTALTVTRRTRDIGIRMALGARPRHIIHVIGRRALVLVIAGLALGVSGSLAFTRVTGSLLFGITPGDSATFAGMSALLAVVSMLAFYFPVRAATRLDAVSAIRHE